MCHFLFCAENAGGATIFMGMTNVTCEYVEQRNGGYYVSGSRVSLASIVSQFEEGASPETIRQNFPTLSLEQVYGSIAFFLAHEKEVRNYLQKLDKKWDELERTAEPADPKLHQRLEEARKHMHARQE
jgi:uncharacterized protein (DUF433 family)